MKFFLLKTLLIRRSKDRGFTLPIVIAIGLVMLLLSAVNLIQSGEEQLNTISKKGSADALAAAEFGIARYRELLNNNRVLAVYNLSEWQDGDGNSIIDNEFVRNQICESVTTTGGGWADSASTNWRAINLAETDFAIDFNDDGDTTDNELVGEYKIVNYEYDNDGVLGDNDDNGDIDLESDAANDITGNGQSDAIGILTVKGRRDGSEAQIQVTIPLGVNTDDFSSLDPALWIEQSSITNIGNVVVREQDSTPSDDTDNPPANIVLYRPSDSGDCSTPTQLASQSTISDPRTLPDIIDLPETGGTIDARGLNGDISTNEDPVLVDPNLNDHIDYPRDHYFQDRDGDGIGEILLGTSFDDNNTNSTQALYTGADGEDRYYYTTGGSDLDIGSGENILADGIGQIILHVGGNLNINTTPVTVSVGGTPTTFNTVFIANSSNNATSKYLEIHVEGNVTINGSGTAEIRGLLHVPNGTVTIEDSVDVNVVGSIWAGDFNNTSSGDVTISTDDYEYYSITSERSPRPLTYRPTRWETQEVN